MKIRIGFVSNSSSSSFMIKNDEEKDDLLGKFPGAHLLSVAKILQHLECIESAVNQARDFISHDPYDSFLDLFNCFNCFSLEEDIKYLRDILTKIPDLKVSEPIDRDLASDKGVKLEVFKGHL